VDRTEQDDIANAEQETTTSAAAAFQIVATGYLIARGRRPGATAHGRRGPRCAHRTRPRGAPPRCHPRAR
jgi:hypothetical protein